MDFNEVSNLDDDGLFELLDKISYEDETKELEELEKIEKLDITEICCEKCDTDEYIKEDNSQGIVVCTNCGYVMENIMDNSPEWRQYNDDGPSKGASRCSMPTNHFLPLSSLGTSIACSSMSKIKILHSWNAMPYKERSLHGVLKEIHERCSKGKILRCIEDDAKILYKNISECKHLEGKNVGKNIIIRGVNRRSLIAACVFYACKRKKQTRSLKEIAKIFNLKYTQITSGCKTFRELMKIRGMEYDKKSSTPEHFVKRFCKKLHIQMDYIEQAITIAKNIEKLNIASVHTPLSIATGSILLMANINNLNVTKKNISDTFGVSEVTITKAFKKLENYKDILLDDVLTDKLVVLLEKEKEKSEVPKALMERYKNL